MNLLETFQFALGKAAETFSGLWPILLLSIVISVALKLYVDQDRVAAFLKRNQRNSVAMSTTLAVATPFCSCGTTAVVLGMMASTVPWAPIVAFLVASPLTSPQQMVYSAGLFGWPFAVTFMASSIILGLVGGALAGFADSRGWLKDQARLRPQRENALPNLEPLPRPGKPKVTTAMALREFFDLSWKLVLMFFGFSFIGYFLNGLIPQEWIHDLFGSGRILSVPLAALLGIPFYLNTEASMPLVRAFMDSGMSAGSALAFLITGAGTSIGALTGALAIARWRVIAIVLGTLIAGAVVFGMAYDMLIPFML
ncbi:MAG TPA: permease [Anaerolineales bacterium]|nr:permease [Anaerolineales bacterium]HNQ93828.1 permease [Anaerolineales bacterium]HNS60467.1 permease [Anaerolineales bacterium]